MKRRTLVTGSLSVTAAMALPGQVGAAPPQPSSLQDLLIGFDSPNALADIIADVRFLHSWRETKQPKGYESDQGWIAEADKTRATLVETLQPQPLGTFVKENSQLMAKYEPVAMSRYDVERILYEQFLQDIGVDPSGPAGTRITNSMKSFALLIFAALGDLVAEKVASGSYMWPFC